MGRCCRRPATSGELRNDPTAHAEILVLREAGQELGGWRIPDAVLYVMIGPPAVWGEGARRASSTGRPTRKAGAAGSGADILAQVGSLTRQPEVAGGLLADECAAP